MKCKEECCELFIQYTVLLDELNVSFENLKSLVGTIEESLLLKEYDEIKYWARQAEVGHATKFVSCAFFALILVTKRVEKLTKCFASSMGDYIST